ncbi:EI24 domain-containing protein [Chryseobacterium sp.]|uniref:EI24 domain-containing protein n=1 Tax=Chryseobacterium sp. TaxID=1871047 RepID=UPI000ECBF4DF|nr:EI24 domain-containing protein [Chryseobacterium sp.]HCA06799.1 hypothetical protein [Chryseobacterium sp.]
METQRPQLKQWYDNKVLLIIFFFLFPPLGIYAMLKHKTDTWKKVLYITPSAIVTILLTIGIIGSFFVDSYKSGLDYYNKKDFVKAYDFFRMVKPDDKNYNDAIAKISEIKIIVDSINTAKENEKLAKNQRKQNKNIEEKHEKGIVDTSLEFPVDQQNFIKVVEHAYSDYKDAPNELKKSAIRTERGNLIKKNLDGKRNFSDWVVVVKEMHTTGKGKAYFTVKIDETNIEMGTVNNELSNMFENSLIEQSNPIYNQISELQKGDVVIISGSFFPSDKSDYIQELSLTEEGSMRKPEFLIKFTNVQKKN